MRSIKLLLVVVGSIAVTLASCGSDDSHTLRISTTTSIHNSGLLDYLVEEFEELTFEDEKGNVYKIEINYIANGSGAAIKLGESGDVDLLIVHSEDAELTFMNNGHGVDRKSFMYNYFYVVGPDELKEDVDLCNELFYSRGDNSGTHVAEKNMWATLGCQPVSNSYKETGKGMLDTLVIANEQSGYTLTDNATWLKNKEDLQYLQKVGDGPQNIYSVITVNPEKNTSINRVDAKIFYDWLISSETAELIEGYQINGESLFYAL